MGITLGKAGSSRLRPGTPSISEGLTKIAELLDSDQLTTNVGEVLPLSEARLAHEMLAGKPHKRGKIVLAVDA